MIVTLLAWIAHKLVSSNRPTKYASLDSWRAMTAELWNRRSVLKSWAISRTNLWNGSFLMSSSVDFWYSTSSRCTLTSSFGSQLLSWSLSSGWFTSGLLGTCHLCFYYKFEMKRQLLYLLIFLSYSRSLVYWLVWI